MSVILPIYNVEQYLAECLDSLLSQSHRDVEIVVVDDGSPDGSRRIAESYARDDSRIRIVTRENGGLGAARNTGVAHASGEYLTFVDSDDKLPPAALSKLLQSARGSGSDVIAGAIQRFRSDRAWKPTWVEPLHSEPRTGITIDDFPALVRNNYTCSKLFRRDFWTEQGLAFREGVSYEDQPLVTQLYIAAARIDVVPDVVYLYRQREDASSISQQTASLKDLRDRISAWRMSRKEFAETASTAVYDAWLKTLFDAHFHWYLRSPGTADLAYWAALRSAIVDLTANAPVWIWESTTPENRVPIELARRNRRADLQEFVRREGNSPSKFPAKVVDGGVRHELPFHDDRDLDPSLFLRRPEQLVLSHSVQTFRWVEGDTMRLGGWAYIRYVDLVGRDVTTTLILSNRRTGHEHAVVAARRAHPAFPPPGVDEWVDYSGSEFEAVVAMADVIGADRRDGDVWDVRLRVETVGFAVEDSVRRVRRSASAGVPGAGELAGGDLLTVAWQLNTPFRLVLRPLRVEAVDVDLTGRTLRGRLAGPQAHEAHSVKVV
ncbi:MAG: glycosyltransferase, partial [Actinomycetia bacterium]|nr:glycosyltransferase [Actinomycetes bacterium]